MKKLRIISALICISLLLSIASPLAFATEAEPLSNIIIDKNYAMYQQEDSEHSFTIYLNTETFNGSFAVIYSNNPEYMYDYLFTLDTDEIDTSSSSFWDNLISDCFAQSSQWTTIYLPYALTYQTEYSAISRTTPETYFTDWLYDKYGAQRTNNVAGYYMRNSQLFVVYESVSYQVNLASSYRVNQAISVAGFITGILGLVAKVGIVSVIGAIAGVAGVIASGTHIDEYHLSVGMSKQVTVQGGSIVHASASKCIHYNGYANPDTGASGVDESSAIISYYPTEDLFEDHNALVDTAWEHFRNP